MTLSSAKQFSALPGIHDPPSLRFKYQKELIRSFAIYLSKLGLSLQLDLSSQIQKIESLEPSFRFSPEIFAIYVHLKDAYLKKDIEALLDCVQSINTLSLEQAYASQLRTHSILTERWEVPFIKELRESTPRDDQGNILGEKAQMFPLVNGKADDFPPPFLSQAETLFKELDPELYLEYETYVTRIKLFSSQTITSSSSPRFFGCIYLRLPYAKEDPLFFYLEYLVHEVSHLHLFVMMSEDAMVLNGANELFNSPIRPDKRPMMGIYHATFVLARLVRIFRKVVEKFPENLDAKMILQTQDKFFKEGLNLVKQHAKLSSIGNDVLQSMTTCAYE